VAADGGRRREPFAEAIGVPATARGHPARPAPVSPAYERSLSRPRAGLSVAIATPHVITIAP
jgi:hypothetical protein